MHLFMLIWNSARESARNGIREPKRLLGRSFGLMITGTEWSRITFPSEYNDIQFDGSLQSL